jgi:hypothetical protein
MCSGYDMHSLEYAPSPGATLVSVRTIEFRFGIVDVCIAHRAIGAHWNQVLAARFTGGDGVRLARANVVVCGSAPLFAVFIETSDENGLFGFFVQQEVSLADDWSEDKIVRLAERLEPSFKSFRLAPTTGCAASVSSRHLWMSQGNRLRLRYSS